VLKKILTITALAAAAIFCSLYFNNGRLKLIRLEQKGPNPPSASPEPKRSPAALLAKSRPPKKSFVFLLEKKSGARK
jgi:hypothetical protein